MANHKIVNEIATEDAAQVLHELRKKDFIDVVATLIKRRAAIHFGNMKNIQKEFIKEISEALNLE